MPDEEVAQLEYRSGGDDHDNVRQQNRRRSRNAFFLLIMMGSVFVGAMAAMLTLCGVFFAVMNARQRDVNWSTLACGATIAVAMLVLAYWVEGFIDSD